MRGLGIIGKWGVACWEGEIRGGLCWQRDLPKARGAWGWVGWGAAAWPSADLEIKPGALAQDLIF